MATFVFPLSGSTNAGFRSPEAYEALNGRGVTFFSSKPMAYAAYAGSALFLIGIIVVDALLISGAGNHDIASNATLTVSIDSEGKNGWLVALASTMISMDVLVLLTTAVDLLYFNYTLWPLTSMTWFGMLLGTGLSSAILGAYSFYAHATTEEMNSKMTLAITGLAMHSIYISSQFAVSLEYVMKSVRK